MPLKKPSRMFRSTSIVWPGSTWSDSCCKLVFLGRNATTPRVEDTAALPSCCVPVRESSGLAVLLPSHNRLRMCPSRALYQAHVESCRPERRRHGCMGAAHQSCVGSTLLDGCSCSCATRHTITSAGAGVPYNVNHTCAASRRASGSCCQGAAAHRRPAATGTAVRPKAATGTPHLPAAGEHASQMCQSAGPCAKNPFIAAKDRRCQR